MDRGGSENVMHEFVASFGPKATPAIVVLFFLIAPIAIWHHVHLIIHIVKTWRKEDSEK